MYLCASRTIIDSTLNWLPRLITEKKSIPKTLASSVVRPMKSRVQMILIDTLHSRIAYCADRHQLLLPPPRCCEAYHPWRVPAPIFGISSPTTALHTLWIV